MSKTPRIHDPLHIIFNQAITIEKLLKKQPSPVAKDQETPRKKFFPAKVSGFSQHLPQLVSSSSHLISSTSSEGCSKKLFAFAQNKRNLRAKKPTIDIQRSGDGSRQQSRQSPKKALSMKQHIPSDQWSNFPNYKGYYLKGNLRNRKFLEKSQVNKENEKSMLDKTHKRILTSESKELALLSKMRQRHQRYRAGKGGRAGTFNMVGTLLKLKEIQEEGRVQTKDDIVKDNTLFFN